MTTMLLPLFPVIPLPQHQPAISALRLSFLRRASLALPSPEFRDGCHSAASARPVNRQLRSRPSPWTACFDAIPILGRCGSSASGTLAGDEQARPVAPLSFDM